MNDQTINIVTEILIGKFNHLGPDTFNLDHELNSQKDPITGRDLTEQEKTEIERRVLNTIRYKRSHDGAILVPISVVTDPREHEEWYDGWLAENNNETGSYYWKRLEHHLSSVLTEKYNPEEAGIIVRSIDEATYGIIKKLANPRRPEFSYKGLVVGYVQSGKTANFSALIAKAADTGYKFIVVLAGIHDILRLQTQIRLDKELTGMNDRGLDEVFIPLPSDAKSWNRLTTANNDFRNVNLGPFTAYCSKSTPTIAIIKKNCRVMDRLINYIRQADEESRVQMPLLVVDDEADQASIDTNANDPDTEPSRTNERIRTLLSLFPKKVYIGYTATPFANVLIDMTTGHERLEDDIYPRNFIASLPEPEGYFGTSTIFEGNLSDCFVRVIPDERNTLINGQITEALMRAIDEFIICCAVRNIRGDREKPMSILIHVSHKIGDMGIIRGLVQDYFSSLRTKFNDWVGREMLRAEYGQIWTEFRINAETINRELSLNNLLPTFEEIWNELSSVLEALSIVELNSASEHTLDYTTGEEIKVIAVGGNQLSRGLTLEGLMTSYYLRPSRQYDTLLQMARWFGYRMGYEDLTRVHTTTELWECFEHLALVEEEMRSEIYRYEEEGRTPAQMAIAIRDHRRLNVTAPNKMGAAMVRQISYSESLNQTIWFPLNSPEILRANYNLGEAFVGTVHQNFHFENIASLFLARNIPGELVLREFLNRYTFADRESTGGPGLDSERLLEYIYRRLNDQNPELQNWSVALVGNTNPIAGSDDPVNYGGLLINRIQRSRKHTERGYNIGVLTEPDHLRIDLREGAISPHDGRYSQNPLLLLYLIWRGSKAGRPVENPQYDERIDLYRYVDSEKIDVLGLGVVLPRSDYEPYNYIGQ
ncbi:MAG TPA: Z1 domain-containing protein [Candidatus Wunengus sp. YC63]|uniref:Z1 domain-containing protein n=1 Tax=unclassified Candidatus Wunengus TaxID=3367695 RepID=UPI0040265BFE